MRPGQQGLLQGDVLLPVRRRVAPGSPAAHLSLPGFGRGKEFPRPRPRCGYCGARIGVCDGALCGASAVRQGRRRPSRTWGSSRRTPERTAGPALGDSVIPLKRPVGGRGSNLQHQMSASGRPAHVLLCVHSPVQQPLHGTFGNRRRNRLVLMPRRGVIDDDIGGSVANFSTGLRVQFASEAVYPARE
jgi:hypothetical protein